MGLIKKILLNDITIFGSFVFYGFLLAFVFVIGERLLSFQLLVAFVVAVVLTLLIRLVYHKDRPKKQKYSGLLEKLDASSFPSLHSMRGALMFMLFALHYRHWMMIVVFGGMALLIFLSRYMLKKHHVSDIVWGAVFGIVIGYAVSLISF